MRRALTVLGMMLCASSLFAAVKIEKTWESEGKQLVMKTVDYSEDIVSRFNKLVVDFHLADFKKSNPGQSPFKDDAEFKMYADAFIQTSSDQFKAGNAFLLLTQIGDEILGGGYFKFEDDGKVVLILHAAFKEGYSEEITVGAQLEMVEALSSAKNFPNAEKLVVFLNSYSEKIDLLVMLGFRSTSFKLQDLPEDQFIGLERPIIAFEKDET